MWFDFNVAVEIQDELFRFRTVSDLADLKFDSYSEKKSALKYHLKVDLDFSSIGFSSHPSGYSRCGEGRFYIAEWFVSIGLKVPSWAVEQYIVSNRP